jgi:hypothetical protein
LLKAKELEEAQYKHEQYHLKQIGLKYKNVHSRERSFDDLNYGEN